MSMPTLRITRNLLGLLLFIICWTWITLSSGGAPPEPDPSTDPAGGLPESEAEGWWAWQAQMLQAEADLILAAKPESGADSDGDLPPAEQALAADRAVLAARQAVSLAVGPAELADARLLLAEALYVAGERTSRERIDVLLDLAGALTLYYRGPLRSEILTQLAETMDILASETTESSAHAEPYWGPVERDQALRYGRLLYTFGRWQAGVDHFAHRPWEPQDVEIAMQLARGLGVLGRWEEAVRLLETHLAHADQHQVWQVQTALAGHLAAAGRWGAAVDLNVMLWQEAPPTQAATALERLVGYLDRSDQVADMTATHVQAILDTENSAPDHRSLARKLLTGNTHLQRETAYQRAVWSLAIDSDGVNLWVLDLLQPVAGTQPRFLYLRAVSGDAEAGGRLLANHPLSYHAWLLRGDAETPVLSAWDPPDPLDLDALMMGRTSLPQRTDLTTSHWREAAAGQLRRVVQGGELDATALQEAYAALVTIDIQRGAYREALGHASTLSRRLGGPPHLASTLLGDAADPQARQVLAWLYPQHYATLVDTLATRLQLPPALLYAVILQESSFERQAISSANARGLMQLLPTTAAWVKESLLHRYETVEDALLPQAAQTEATPLEDRLYDPETNAPLGATYLRWLLDRYGNLRLAVAAYHAGQGNVDRWLREAGWERPIDEARTDREIDMFIEQIPIHATREYVYKVYEGYRIFQILLAAE